MEMEMENDAQAAIALYNKAGQRLASALNDWASGGGDGEEEEEEAREDDGGGCTTCATCGCATCAKDEADGGDENESDSDSDSDSDWLPAEENEEGDVIYDEADYDDGDDDEW